MVFAFQNNLYIFLNLWITVWKSSPSYHLVPAASHLKSAIMHDCPLCSINHVYNTPGCYKITAHTSTHIRLLIYNCYYSCLYGRHRIEVSHYSKNLSNFFFFCIFFSSLCFIHDAVNTTLNNCMWLGKDSKLLTLLAAGNIFHLRTFSCSLLDFTTRSCRHFFVVFFFL